MASLPYQLRVGVTGHRDLGDEKPVRAAVAALIRYIQKTLNYANAPVEWTVISALARGADSVAAEEVLAIGGRLETILPLPQEEYRKDFAEGDERDRFDRLIVQGSVAETKGTGRSGEGGGRKLAYLSAGETVVNECEILVCVWDRERKGGKGGTAEVVAYALRRRRMVLWIDARNPGRPARRLVLTKKESMDATAAPATASTLSPGYHQQAKYSSDDALSDATLDKRTDALRERLEMERQSTGLSKAALDGVFDRYGRDFVRADELALHYQRRYRLAMRAVLYLAAGAVSVAAAQRLFLPEETWPISFEAAAMVGVFLAWWWCRRGAWLQKWLHDRYLAEGMRVAMFAGLVRGTEGPARREDPLPFYPGPQEWMDGMVRRLCAAPPPRPESAGPVREFLASAWLDDQARHHLENAARERRIARERGFLGLLLFGATLLLALLHLSGVGEGTAAAAWTGFLVLVLPARAGAVHAGTAQMELHRIEARSERMAERLELLGRQTERSQSMDELQTVVEEAASLMAVENREWWALLSFQDVKLQA